MSQKKIRVLFVCMGNICRSPAGENVMRHLIQQAGVEDRFELDSAGTISMHVGNPPDPRMTEATENRNIAVTGRARQVKAIDFERFDWILAMDEDNYQDLLHLQDQALAPIAKLVKFCEFCTEHDEEDVPDPYYGGPEGFEKVLDLLEDGCAKFIQKVL